MATKKNDGGKTKLEPITILTGVLTLGKSIVGNWLERKTKKQAHKTKMVELKQNLKEKVISAQIESDTTIDRINTETMATSWKDEFLLLVFFIPVIMCFIPTMDVYVKAGFAALAETPMWYQVIVLVMSLTVYGHRKLARMFASRLLGGNTNGDVDDEYRGD